MSYSLWDHPDEPFIFNAEPTQMRVGFTTRMDDGGTNVLVMLRRPGDGTEFNFTMHPDEAVQIALDIGQRALEAKGIQPEP